MTFAQKYLAMHKSTGEPDAVKAARPVRRGLVGKVPAYGR
jgi:hypothetical protein